MGEGAFFLLSSAMYRLITKPMAKNMTLLDLHTKLDHSDRRREKSRRVGWEIVPPFNRGLWNESPNIIARTGGTYTVRLWHRRRARVCQITQMGANPITLPQITYPFYFIIGYLPLIWFFRLHFTSIYLQVSYDSTKE